MTSNYVLMWGEKVSLLIVDISSRCFIDFSNVIGDNVRESIVYIKDRKILQAYYNEEDYKNVKKEHAKYFLEKDNIKNLLNIYEQLENEFNELVRGINKNELAKLSSKELSVLFEKYYHLIEKVCAYFRSTRPESEICPAKKLKESLSKFYSKKETEEKFNVLVESGEKDLIVIEKINWLKIIKKLNVTDNELLNHAKKYPWLFLNFYDYEKAVQFLRNRLLEERLKLNEKRKDVEKSLTRLKNIKCKQEGIIKKSNFDEDIITFSKMFQNFGLYRLRLKSVWAGAEFLCLPLFEEICKRIGIDIGDFFDCYTVKDVQNYLEKQKILANDEIENRKKCVVYVIKDKKSNILSGREGLNFIEKTVEKAQEEVSILEGTVVSQGIVRGRVRIVPSTNVEELVNIAKDFENGNILVTDMTQPHMIFLMKKAGAIVTNVGGLTSHAAIISREFGVPCIVGTLKATKVLKDGDLVEVDAFKGIVRKIR